MQDGGRICSQAIFFFDLRLEIFERSTVRRLRRRASTRWTAALIAIDNEGCALGVKACLDNLGAAGVPHLVAVLPKLLDLLASYATSSPTSLASAMDSA